MSVRFRLQNMLETDGEALVDHRVPERQHARLLAGQVARAEDRVGVPVEQRPEQARILAGSYSRSASWMREKSPVALSMAVRTAAPLPAILLVPVEPDLRETRRPAAAECPRCRRWSSRPR